LIGVSAELPHRGVELSILDGLPFHNTGPESGDLEAAGLEWTAQWAATVGP
jgi:hypothetical protein